MKNKNVKGIISLLLAIASVICMVIALIFPMTALNGFGFKGETNYYGTPNLALSIISLLLAIAASVFGFLAAIGKNKKGPRKSVLIIGIAAVILCIFSSVAVGMFASVTEYINSEGQSGYLAESAKKDPEQKKSIDKMVKELQKSAGIPETGIGLND